MKQTSQHCKPDCVLGWLGRLYKMIRKKKKCILCFLTSGNYMLPNQSMPMTVHEKWVTGQGTSLDTISHTPPHSHGLAEKGISTQLHSLTDSKGQISYNYNVYILLTQTTTESLTTLLRQHLQVSHRLLMRLNRTSLALESKVKAIQWVSKPLL